MPLCGIGQIIAARGSGRVRWAPVLSQLSDSPSLGDPPSETGETIPTEAEASQEGAGAAPQRSAAGTLPPDRALVGRVLGRFRVVQELAAGGLGEVYRAEQEMLGRDAVIKVMRRDRPVTPARAERFLREARLAARLDHPYAAHVYAFGAEPDGLLWIAMELVRGQTLRALVRQRGPMPPALFAPLAVALCEVVHAAHELGIVHRDLKPANVMVMASGGRLLPKLIDFGVAKAFDDGELPAGRAGVPVSVELTREDQALGSPHYMAPEQWASPGAVDRRADVFALGAVFYYLLSGQPPFRGNTADELARARIETVPAPVGGGVPGALDAVLARALASDPARRFPTALELASALSAAVAASAVTPSLDPLLVETWSARAPEPLAELVFALSGARTATEADATARILVEALCRWLAVLALAEQRGHDGGPPERARQLGRGLLARGLSSAEWLELAQVLVAAGAGSSASGAVIGGAGASPGTRASGSGDGSSDYTPVSGTWPPARAALDSSPYDRAALLPPDGIRPLGEFLAGAGAAALAELAAPRDPLPPGASLHARLSADMARLGAVLAQLGSMLDTALVADVAGQPLELSGLRRRRPAALWGPPLAPGELALIGAGGAARLTLSPLVALAPAVPGGDPEVFMLAGGPRGPCLRALPSGAEISGGDAVRQVADALDLTADQVETGESGEDAPYRGLAPFSAGDAARFVGRAREAESFINLLRARRLVGLVGASGAGKSSFLQAGVLAALPEGWTHVSLRPGATPVRALLAAAGVDLPASATAETIAEALVARAPASGALVVAVDQMEELFALGAPAEERERFVEALVAAADGAGGRVRAVLCLRDDFLARAEALGPLRGRLASALTVLVTPAPAELRRIVVEPAERAGYWFEDEAVVDEMVAAIADRPGGLALLSFAALAWWERRDRERHLLPTAAYRRLGGVAGALASHADALYAGMPASAQRAARDIIRQLVTAEGTRAALPAADLVRLAGPGGEQALDGLIAGRLLVARDDVDGDVVELAHESLIEVWPLLRRIREEDAADAGLRDDLRAAARGWSQRQRGDDELWRGRALAELERFRARAGVRLTSLEEEFADASRALGRRTRRRRRGLVIAAIGAAAAAAVVLGLAERDARHSEARARTLAEQARRGEVDAELRLAKTWAVEGQRESARGSPLRALAYLLPAYGRVDGSGTRFAIARAMASIDEERAVLRGHTSSIHSLEWSHDGRMLATVDEEAATRLWRFDRGRVEPIDIGDGRGMFLGFGAGDKVFGLGDVKDGSIVLRAIAGNKEVARISGLTSKETRFDGHFSDNGGTMLLYRSDGVLWIYGADGKLRKRAATGQKIDFAESDRSGRHVFLAGETGGLHLWDVKRGKGREVLPISFGGLAISDRGDVVVAGGADGNTYVIDGIKGAQRHVLASHPGRHYTAVTRDGRWIATGGYDRTAKLWQAATGRLVATLHEHRGPVSVVGVRSDRAAPGHRVRRRHGAHLQPARRHAGRVRGTHGRHPRPGLEPGRPVAGVRRRRRAGGGVAGPLAADARDLERQPGARPDRGVRQEHAALVREGAGAARHRQRQGGAAHPAGRAALQRRLLGRAGRCRHGGRCAPVLARRQAGFARARRRGADQRDRVLGRRPRHGHHQLRPERAHVGRGHRQARQDPHGHAGGSVPRQLARLLHRRQVALRRRLDRTGLGVEHRWRDAAAPADPPAGGHLAGGVARRRARGLRIGRSLAVDRRGRRSGAGADHRGARRLRHVDRLERRQQAAPDRLRGHVGLRVGRRHGRAGRRDPARPRRGGRRHVRRRQDRGRQPRRPRHDLPGQPGAALARGDPQDPALPPALPARQHRAYRARDAPRGLPPGGRASRSSIALEAVGVGQRAVVADAVAVPAVLLAEVFLGRRLLRRRLLRRRLAGRWLLALAGWRLLAPRAAARCRAAAERLRPRPG